MSELTHKSRTRQITLAAVFSAIYVILRVVPTFRMIGTSSQFTAGDFMLTTIAAIAGVWSGTVAVIVGTVVSYAIHPPIFLGLDFLPGVVNVMITGLLLAGRRQAARGIYFLILIVYLASPYSLLYGYDHIPFAWLHLAAFVVLLSPIASRMPAWVKVGGYRDVSAFAALAFIGTMAQHLTGGLLYELSFGYLAGISAEKFSQFWYIIFYLYPEERLIVVTISTILVVAIYRSFQRWAPPSWRD